MKRFFLIAALSIAALATIAQSRVNSPRSYQQILNEKYTNGLFRSAEGTIFDLENENVQSYFNILDWLEGRIAGLQVFVSGTGIRVPVIRGTVAGIYVDEMRMDPSFLNSLSVNDIGMIKVIKGPFAGAFGNGGGGTIAIYTTRADEAELDLNSD